MTDTLSRETDNETDVQPVVLQSSLYPRKKLATYSPVAIDRCFRNLSESIMGITPLGKMETFL